MGYIHVKLSKEFTRAHFVNVIIHELGHVLGLPHVRDYGNNYQNLSEFMLPAGFGCKEYYRDQICNFTDYDFEAFLKPLALDSPDGKLMTREEVKQWNIESLIQDSLAGWEGDIAIECGRGSSLCGSITSFYYKERDRLREYYYGGQYDADLRQKKAQEWIDKFGGSTDTSYYRDRVNNRE